MSVKETGVPIGVPSGARVQSVPSLQISMMVLAVSAGDGLCATALCPFVPVPLLALATVAWGLGTLNLRQLPPCS